MGGKLRDINTISLSDAGLRDVPFSITRLSLGPQSAFYSQPRRHETHFVIWIESDYGANVIDFKPA